MHKGLNILPALLLCANIAVGAQDSDEQLRESRVKPTDASGIILASRMSNYCRGKDGKLQDIKTLNDTGCVSFSITKVGIDPLAIVFPIITLAELYYGIKYTHQQKDALAKAALGIMTTMGAMYLLEATLARLLHNDKLTHSQHLIKTQYAANSVMLEKQNETWKVSYKGVDTIGYLPELSDEEAQQLAEAIIAGHNPDVQDEDLYTSEIFQKLISDFKARC